MAVKLNRTTIGQTNVSYAADKVSRGRFVSAFAAALLALAIVAGSGVSASGQAQFPGPKKDKERNAPKNLSGQVVDKDGIGIPQAIVYLKDKKTLEMKTHISDEKGAYRFTGLDPNEDYEVHAESKGAASSKRTVSSFDDRKEIYLVLELGAAK
jgi:carboxypeptidase family protein